MDGVCVIYHTQAQAQTQSATQKEKNKIMAMAMSLGMGPQAQWMGVPKRSGYSSGRRRRTGVRSSLQAVIFDCDGVILESEHLHRQAYNEAFAHFKVGCEWSPEFYDDLQNRIGGGKPKMRWYFNTFGWPCDSEEDRAELIDTLQDWKTERYKAILNSGTVSPRPGVLPLMDHVKAAGLKLAVCSAATKTSVILCLENLIGLERFQALDCFLAGDDVKLKKPDPSIYVEASRRLGVSGKDCIVIEDSVIGLQAATGAGMPCVITYTSSTADQDFKDAIAVYPDLTNVSLTQLDQLLQLQQQAAQ